MSYLNISFNGEPVVNSFPAYIGGRGYVPTLWTKSYAFDLKSLPTLIRSGEAEYIPNTCPCCGGRTETEYFGDGFQECSTETCTICEWGETT